jgi:3,2-trans-enoyl-CoA isomerase
MSLVVTKKSELGVATLVLSSKPVNALSTHLMTDVINAVKSLENDKSVQAVVITSAYDKIFSAGLNLKELYKPKPENFKRFWGSLQEMIYTIYKSRLVTIAAINGECPAGGCILSMACDYRIMLDGFKIGLNEAKIGLVAPAWAIDLMKNTIGFRPTDMLCQKGSLISSQEALKIGLVDEVVTTIEELQDRVTSNLKEWLNVIDFARSRTKLEVRKDFLLNFEKTRDAEIEMLISMNDAMSKELGPIMMKMFSKSKL